MTYKLKAHWEGDVVVLDEPVPPGARSSRPLVLVESSAATAIPTAEEKAQSASGFARQMLLDPAEDIWEHD